ELHLGVDGPSEGRRAFTGGTGWIRRRGLFHPAILRADVANRRAAATGVTRPTAGMPPERPRPHARHWIRADCHLVSVNLRDGAPGFCGGLNWAHPTRWGLPRPLTPT